MDFKPRGIIPPIVTPFTGEGKLNEPVLRRLVDFLIDNGVHGLFPMGTTGEFYAVDDDVYHRVLEVTVEAAAGRVPVYAGCNHITTQGCVRLAKIAEKVGVAALSVLSPMFLSPRQEELYGFFKTISEATPLPIIMYNNKPKTNSTIAPETVARLSELKNIVGVKDSTGDFTNTEEYLRLTRHNPDFSVLLGRDTLIYAGLCYGAKGAIASCANVAPRLAADIYDKFMQGDFEGAREAQFALAPLRIAAGMGTFPEVIKEGLAMQGIPVGKCVEPIQELLPNEKAHLRDVLEKMGIPLNEEGHK